MSIDPFTDDLVNKPTFRINKIHIRIQQRTARKHITIIEGLDPKLDLKRIVSHFRQTFGCNGNIVNGDNPIIQLSGDQRQNVNDFLKSEKIAKTEEIIMHGY